MFYLTIMKLHIYDILTKSPKNERAILLMKQQQPLYNKEDQLSLIFLVISLSKKKKKKKKKREDQLSKKKEKEKGRLDQPKGMVWWFLGLIYHMKLWVQVS